MTPLIRYQPPTRLDRFDNLCHQAKPFIFSVLCAVFVGYCLAGAARKVSKNYQREHAKTFKHNTKRKAKNDNSKQINKKRHNNGYWRD